MNKPEPPLNRVKREGCSVICDNCGSTMSRSGFMMLFGKRYCDNDKCINSQRNYNGAYQPDIDNTTTPPRKR